MKKLGKLTINPEKLIKNDELVNLKGGYCSQCEECHGTVTICASAYDQARQDYFDNCGPGSSIYWDIIPGC